MEKIEVKIEEKILSALIWLSWKQGGKKMVALVILIWAYQNASLQIGERKPGRKWEKNPNGKVKYPGKKN